MTKIREIYRCQICGNVVEVVNLRDKLVVKIGTPALQITLPSQFYIDEILRHRQRLLHLLALVQIDGKGRREAVDETS